MFMLVDLGSDSFSNGIAYRWCSDVQIGSDGHINYILSSGPSSHASCVGWKFQPSYGGGYGVVTGYDSSTDQYTYTIYDVSTTTKRTENTTILQSTDRNAYPDSR